MAGFSEILASQLARPAGLPGRAIGRAMDIANRNPTRLALDLLAPRDGERILDAGCGTGAALARMIRRAQVDAVGVDPSPTMIHAAHRRLRGRASLLESTVERMPFAEASFDAVLALNVLYFAGRDGAMAKRLFEVLRPGGRLIAYVTHREAMERWRFAQAGRHRLFDAGELAALVAAGGFVRERIWVQEVPVTRSIRGLLVKALR